MNSFMEKYVKNKTVGFWLGLGAACAMLVADILLIALDYGDITFSAITFSLIIVGAAIEIAYCFLDYKFLDFMPLLACACFGIALGAHWYLGLESLSDLWNGVNFIGGNQQAALGFGIVFAIGTVASIVSCFMNQKKNKN